MAGSVTVLKAGKFFEAVFIKRALTVSGDKSGILLQHEGRRTGHHAGADAGAAQCEVIR